MKRRKKLERRDEVAIASALLLGTSFEVELSPVAGVPDRWRTGLQRDGSAPFKTKADAAHHFLKRRGLRVSIRKGELMDVNTPLTKETT